MATILLVPLLILQLAALAAFNIYSLALNTTNHTGFPLHCLALSFALTMLPAVAAMLWKRRVRPLPLLILAVGLLGMANIVLFQWFNIMLPYGEWLRRGMP